jgi:predicted DNA-binding transcriptional regulator AlpA
MTVQHPAASEAIRIRYLTPDQVCELIPGMTKSNLAAMRFRGEGPRYRKPTPKVVVYLESEVVDWLESTARQGTAAEAV